MGVDQHMNHFLCTPQPHSVCSDALNQVHSVLKYSKEINRLCPGGYGHVLLIKVANILIQKGFVTWCTNTWLNSIHLTLALLGESETVKHTCLWQSNFLLRKVLWKTLHRSAASHCLLCMHAQVSWAFFFLKRWPKACKRLSVNCKNRVVSEAIRSQSITNGNRYQFVLPF